MGSIVDLLGNDGFHVGLLLGALGAVLAAGLGLVAPRGPWAGLAFVAAALAGLDDRGMLDGLPDGLGWVVPALVVVVALGGALVTDFDLRHGGLAGAPALLAVTVFGCWVTVPETQHVVVLMGAVLPVALLGWLRPPTRLGIPGALLAVAVVAWVVAVDGHARGGAVVGGFACLGVMAVEPVVRRLAGLSSPAPEPRRAPRPSPGPLPADWALVAVHVVLVAWCSRVAGLVDSAGLALVLVAVGYATASAVVARMRSEVTGPEP